MSEAVEADVPLILTRQLHDAADHIVAMAFAGDGAVRAVLKEIQPAELPTADRLILASIERIDRARLDVTIDNVSADLRRQEELEVVGGPQELSRLLDLDARPEQVGLFAQRLRDVRARLERAEDAVEALNELGAKVEFPSSPERQE